MGKGGGGGGTTTSVQKADPWSGVQPGLNALYSGALQNYGTGGPQYYPGNTLAPSNWNIDHALELGYQTGGQNVTTTNNAIGGLQRTANGVSPSQNPAYGTLQPFAGGQVVGSNPAQSILTGLANGSSGVSPVVQDTLGGMSSGAGTFGQFGDAKAMNQNVANPYLSSEANGEYLSNNPYLAGLYKSATDPMVEQFKNATSPGLASQFSLAGRTGSGAHAAAFEGAGNSLARGLGTASANIYGTAYENERQRQQQAINTLSSNYNTERGMQLQGAQGRLSAAQALGNINSQERSDRLGAANALGGLYSGERGMQLKAAEDLTSQYGMERGLQQQAQLGIPGLAASNFTNLDKMLGVGQLQQSQQQDQINADKARFDFNQQRPTMNLQLLNALLQGGSAYAGNSKTSNDSLNRNPFASALGGAATFNALGGALGGTEAGSMLGGPFGMLGGALLGGLFG